MGKRSDDPEISRRGIGSLLAAVGGAAGIAAMTGCLKNARGSTEEQGSTAQSLTGSNITAWQPVSANAVSDVASVDPSGSYPSGATIFVWELRSYFMLDRSSVAAPDGVNVIAVGTGGGNWVRCPQGDLDSNVVIQSGQTISLTQGGTTASPTWETLLSLQPVDSSKPPYSVVLREKTFNSTNDYLYFNGYNLAGTATKEPVTYLAIENDYEYSPGNHKHECYFQTSLSPASTAYRPFGFVLDRDTGAVTTTLQFAGASFVLMGGPIENPSRQQWYVVDGVFQVLPDPYGIEAAGNLYIATAPDKQIEIKSGGQLNLIAKPGDYLFLAGDIIGIGQGNTVQTATIDNTVSGARFYPVTDNTGSVGLPTNRWSAIYGATITSGDLQLADPERGAEWLLREQPSFILAVNKRTGERRKLLTAPLSEEDEAELRKHDPQWAALVAGRPATGKNASPTRTRRTSTRRRSRVPGA